MAHAHENATTAKSLLQKIFPDNLFTGQVLPPTKTSALDKQPQGYYIDNGTQTLNTLSQLDLNVMLPPRLYRMNASCVLSICLFIFGFWSSVPVEIIRSFVRLEGGDVTGFG